MLRLCEDDAAADATEGAAVPVVGRHFSCLIAGEDAAETAVIAAPIDGAGLAAAP